MIFVSSSDIYGISFDGAVEGDGLVVISLDKDIACVVDIIKSTWCWVNTCNIVIFIFYESNIGFVIGEDNISEIATIENEKIVKNTQTRKKEENADVSQKDNATPEKILKKTQKSTKNSQKNKGIKQNNSKKDTLVTES